MLFACARNIEFSIPHTLAFHQLIVLTYLSSRLSYSNQYPAKMVSQQCGIFIGVEVRMVYAMYVQLFFVVYLITNVVINYIISVQWYGTECVNTARSCKAL